MRPALEHEPTFGEAFDLAQDDVVAATGGAEQRLFGIVAGRDLERSSPAACALGDNSSDCKRSMATVTGPRERDSTVKVSPLESPPCTVPRTRSRPTSRTSATPLAAGPGALPCNDRTSPTGTTVSRAPVVPPTRIEADSASAMLAPTTGGPFRRTTIHGGLTPVSPEPRRDVSADGCASGDAVAPDPAAGCPPGTPWAARPSAPQIDATTQPEYAIANAATRRLDDDRSCMPAVSTAKPRTPTRVGNPPRATRDRASAGTRALPICPARRRVDSRARQNGTGPESPAGRDSTIRPPARSDSRGQPAPVLDASRAGSLGRAAPFSAASRSRGGRRGPGGPRRVGPPRLRPKDPGTAIARPRGTVSAVGSDARHGVGAAPPRLDQTIFALAFRSRSVARPGPQARPYRLRGPGPSADHARVAIGTDSYPTHPASLKSWPSN